MRNILLTFLIFAYYIAFSQGFSKSYLLDYRYLEFTGIDLHNDTINAYCFVISKDSIPKYGVALAKLDTNGNFLSVNTHYRDNEVVGYGPNRRLLRTKNNEYVGIINLFGNKTSLIKFASNGKIAKIFNYKDANSKTEYFNTTDIIEVDGGFVIEAIIGDSKKYTLKFFKIDKNLEKMIWDKDYIDSKFDYMSWPRLLNTKGVNIKCIIPKSDILKISDTDKCTYQNYEFTIDSLGNKISETYIKGLDRFYPEGTIEINKNFRTIYGFRVLKYTPFEYKMNIVQMDSNNQILKNQLFKDTVHFGIIQGILGKDDNMIFSGYGSIFTFVKGLGDYFSNAGMLYKFNKNGKLLWQKKDTIHNMRYINPKFIINPKFNPDRRFFSAVELPSGSIIAGGFSDKYSYDEAKDSITDFHTEAWLYKVDKNGCMSPKDCAIVSTKDEIVKPSAENITIFPNPAHHDVTIKTEKNTIQSIEIYDINAKRLKHLNFETESFEVKITLPENTTPVFLLKIKMSDGSIAIQKVMKM